MSVATISTPHANCERSNSPATSTGGTDSGVEVDSGVVRPTLIISKNQSTPSQRQIQPDSMDQTSDERSVAGKSRMKQMTLGSLIFDEESDAFVSVKGNRFRHKETLGETPGASTIASTNSSSKKLADPPPPNKRDAFESRWWRRDPEEVTRMAQMKNAFYVPPTPGQLPVPMKGLTIPPYVARVATASVDIDTVSQDINSLQGVVEEEVKEPRKPVHPATPQKSVMSPPPRLQVRQRASPPPPSRHHQRLLEALLTDEEVLQIGSVEPWNEKVSDAFSEFHRTRTVVNSSNAASAVAGVAGNAGGMPGHLYHPVVATSGVGMGLGVPAGGVGAGVKSGGVKGFVGIRKPGGDCGGTGGGGGVVNTGGASVKREGLGTLPKRKDAVEEVDLRQVRFDVVRTAEWEGGGVRLRSGEDNRDSELCTSSLGNLAPGDSIISPPSSSDSHPPHSSILPQPADTLHATSQPPVTASNASTVPPRSGDQELVDEWRQQRLIATLTMRELRKIFPPLMQQYLHKKRDRRRHGVAGGSPGVKTGRGGGRVETATTSAPALYHHPLLTPEGNLVKVNEATPFL
ncbi:hypothetical protein HDU67_001983 [Dinochytrium kinnereticum]|nr:hypothetical protein HDU67_001983 [Dinochytrium kinnereticum]